MAQGSINVQVVIDAQDRGAAQKLLDLKRAAGELGVQFNAATTEAKRFGDTAGALGALRGGLNGLLGQVTALAAGYLSLRTVGSIFTQTVGAIERVQQAAFQLGAAIRATGDASGLTANQIKAFAEQMQRTTLFKSEEIEHAAAVLMTFRGIQGETFKEALRYAADLSAAFGEDLQSAVLKLGRAFEDPVEGTTMLRRAGIQFTESEKEQMRTLVDAGNLVGAQAVILDKLRDKFSGTAEALNQGLLGSITGVKHAWEDLLASLDNPQTGLGSFLKTVADDAAQAIVTLRQAIAPTTAEEQAFDMADASQRIEQLGGKPVYGQSPSQALASVQAQRETLIAPKRSGSEEERQANIEDYNAIIAQIQKAIAAQEELNKAAADETRERDKAAAAAKKSADQIAAEERAEAAKRGQAKAERAATAYGALEDRSAEQRAEEQRTKAKERYDAGLDDTHTYYAKLIAIETEGINREIQTKMDLFAKSTDLAERDRIGKEILNLYEKLSAKTEEFAAEEKRKLDEIEKKGQETARTSIASGIGDARSTLASQVESIRADVSTGSVTKAEGARELATAYDAALASLRKTYSAAEELAAVTQDPKDAEQLRKIADAYREIQAQAEKATEATNEFARSLGDAAGKAFSQFFDSGISQFRQFGKAMRAEALSIVKDLEHAVTEPLSKQVNETVKNWTASLFQKSKTAPGSVPTPDPNALVHAGTQLTSAGSSLTAAASRLSAAAAQLTASGRGNQTQSSGGAVAGATGPGAASAPASVPGADSGADAQSPEEGAPQAQSSGVETVTNTAASSIAGTLLSVPEIKGSPDVALPLELVQGLTSHLSQGAPLASSSGGPGGAGALDSAGAALRSSASALTQAASQLSQAAQQLSQSSSGGGGLGSFGGGDLGSIFGGGAGDAVGGAAAGAAGAGGDIASAVGDAGDFASGGFIRGAGTGTSDSIPAMLSHGEFVMPAHRVAQPGMFHHLETIRTGGVVNVPSFSVRTPHSFARGGPVAHFSAGGLVMSHAGEARRGGEHHITVGLEEGLVAKHIESSDGEHAVLNVVSRNRDGMKSALQIP